MRFQQAPYRIADVVALLFIAHGNTSFGSLAPIIPYRSCKHYLNAAAKNSLVTDTRITTWDNTGHATQRWDYSESVPGKPQHYWLKNSANRSYAVTCYGTDGQQVTLQSFTRNMTTQPVKFINEGGSSFNIYGLANTTYILALTTTGSYNGAPVLWKGSNNQNNQLWVLGAWG